VIEGKEEERKGGGLFKGLAGVNESWVGVVESGIRESGMGESGRDTGGRERDGEGTGDSVDAERELVGDLLLRLRGD
jgi:hypothetical protein